MKNFINLTSKVINKLHIIEIIKKPNMYHICMSNSSIQGNIHGYILGVTGNIGGDLVKRHNVIEICQKNNKEDYDTITDLIK